MPQPSAMLGGIPLELHSGAPVLSEEPIGGESSARLSGGNLVSMTHWERMSGTISGSGWMPPGLDGLDYSQPLELRLTSPETMSGVGASFLLHCDPRPDQAPWAYAEVAGRQVRTPCVALGRAVTVTAVAGAERYIVQWMPKYWVFAKKPPRERSRSYAWSILWEEV